MPAKSVNNGTHRKSVKLSSEEKYCIGKKLYENPKALQSLMNKTGLKERTLYKYRSSYLSNTVLHSSAGRPNKLDDIAEQELKQKLSGEKRIQYSIEEVEDLYADAVSKTAERRNKSKAQGEQFCKKTLKNTLRKVGANIHNAEETTDAREKACNDIYHFVTFAAMNQAVVPHVKEPLILNFDAKQSKVGDVDDRKRKAVNIGKVKFDYSYKVRKRKNHKGIGAFFIKTYALISRLGHLAPTVDVISSPGMGPTEIDAYKVHGLGGDIGTQSYGYVVFCKSRGCNKAFYQWYNKTVLIPFIQELRNKYELSDEDMAFVCCDGETIQIEAYVPPNKLVNTLIQKNIATSKLPASTTEILQPCDAGKLFLAWNSKLKNISNNQVINQSYMIDILRKKVFKTHNNKLASKGKKELSSLKVRMGSLGLLRIQKALQESATPDMIRKSFEVVGQSPLSIKTTLSHCRANIVRQQESVIYRSIENLSKLFLEQGELYDHQIQECGINPTVPCPTPKEQLNLSRRRSVLLTNKLVQNNLRAMQNNKKKNNKRPKDKSMTTAEQKKKSKTSSAASKPKPKQQPKQKRAPNSKRKRQNESEKKIVKRRRISNEESSEDEQFSMENVDESMDSDVEE